MEPAAPPTLATPSTRSLTPASSPSLLNPLQLRNVFFRLPYYSPSPHFAFNWHSGSAPAFRIVSLILHPASRTACRTQLKQSSRLIYYVLRLPHLTGFSFSHLGLPFLVKDNLDRFSNRFCPFLFFPIPAPHRLKYRRVSPPSPPDSPCYIMNCLQNPLPPFTYLVARLSNTLHFLC